MLRQAAAGQRISGRRPPQIAPDILGKILNKDNLNRAYKRVKANNGAPGIDGMTIEEAFLWLKEHNHELTERIRKGHYILSCSPAGKRLFQRV